MATLSADVLAMLACPVCKSSLELEQADAKEVVACRSCGRRFPVVDGIPVLIPARAAR